jgi:uncharacterized membrane protein
VAILVNDGKNKLYSFHIWQAFLMHITVGVLSAVIYAFILPKYILSLDVSLRTPIFLKLTIIPIVAFMLLIVTLGILAFRGNKFNIPLIGNLADKISNRGGN